MFAWTENHLAGSVRRDLRTANVERIVCRHLGKLLVERKVGVAPPELSENSPLTSGTNERFLVTSGASAGSYTVDIAAPSGYRNRVAGVTLDAQGRFTLPESALSPLESNAVRMRKDGQVGSGYSTPVSLAYDPTVTATSPSPVRALAIHWASNNLVVRWSLAQGTGKAQRLFFRSSDGLTTVLLTPTALPSSVLSYTLASQALSAPCGALYLETLEAAASPMAGLPSAEAGEQGIGMNPCPGGAPDPPSGPAFVNWYHHRDHLGTLRNVTDEAGYVVVGYDDYPYGARMPQSATPSVGGSTRQFTGHERDAATGLDYMGARYYGSAAAAFVSADTVTGELLVPSSFNRYSYAFGNPLRYRDPDGRYGEDFHNDLTQALAMAVGYSDGLAGVIAAADWNVDSVYSAYESRQNRREWHSFGNSTSRQDVLIEAGVSSQDPKDLGRAVHVIQDAYSHAGFGDLGGHILAGHEPDKTEKNPQRAVDAARNTYNVLLSVGNQTGQLTSPPVPFSQIEKQVRAWTGCSDPAMKAALLRSIEGKMKRLRTVIQAKNAQTPFTATGPPPTK